jgi:anti-sigma regulatory factor (Ser/Thr protein kinase)
LEGLGDGKGKYAVEPSRKLYRSFPGDASAPGSARHALDPLKDQVSDEAFSVLSLLVTELVTNSVKHSNGPPDGPIELRVQWSTSGVRVEVTDRGDIFSLGEIADSALASSGRGLLLVDRLSSAWGVNDSEPNTVWFELDRINTGTSVSGVRAKGPPEKLLP